MRASSTIKFLAGSCLSGLGIVLKEPSAIFNFIDESPVKAKDFYEKPRQVLSLRTLIPRVFSAKNLIVLEAAMASKVK
jgi:hypothetical protein